MINRFGSVGRSSDTLRILAQKGKFNRILEDRLHKESNHFIMDVNVAVNEARFFTSGNELNGDGRIRFWEEVNEQLQLFDFKKLSLKPLKKDDKSPYYYPQRVPDFKRKTNFTQHRGQEYHDRRDFSYHGK